MKDPAVLEPAVAAPTAEASADAAERHPFLVALGDRVRTLRSRRGMTRKAVAIAAEVSRLISLQTAPWCLLVIPLLAESGRYDRVHRVLVVDLPIQRCLSFNW